MTYPSHELHYYSEVIEDYVKRTPRTDTPSFPVYLGLLSTCTTIYDETQTFPFALATFQFDCMRDFARFHASLSYEQRRTVEKLRFEFCNDGIPDVYNVDDSVVFDDRFRKYRKNSELSYQYVQRSKANAAENVAGKEKECTTVTSKAEKQLARAKRTAERKQARKGVDGSEEITTETSSHRANKKGPRTMVHLVPELERIEIGYVFHGPFSRSMPDTEESREKIFQDVNMPWKRENWRLLEKWLMGGKVKVVHLPGRWYHENSRVNGAHWADLEQKMRDLEIVGQSEFA